jgi:hypothetical protein
MTFRLVLVSYTIRSTQEQGEKSIYTTLVRAATIFRIFADLRLREKKL